MTRSIIPWPPNPQVLSRRGSAALWGVLALALVLGGCGRKKDKEERAALPDIPLVSRERIDDGKPHAHTNRLARERSPYLRQHGHNPVDWYPWGAEALAKAKAENKPIFLSIGYSTCHWCHVMAEESFENEALAAYLNQNFVPIKVDREERPDLDIVYQSAVQALTGTGGWPLTVFLTPELSPFAGGTYFPPEPRDNLPGLRQVAEAVHGAWTTARSQVDLQAEQVMRVLKLMEPGAIRDTTGIPLDAAVIAAAGKEALRTYDILYGGFGSLAQPGPKFPTPYRLSFLFRYAARDSVPQAMEAARWTLEHIAAGGIHDHVGGGFHRYSVDRVWSVPHFEKMLYDQAGLALAYLDAWKVTGRPEHADAARDALDYALRDLRHPQGGFFSAEDAQTEGKEGKYYVWSAAEIDSVLGPERGALFRQHYGIPADGGRYIPRLQGWDHGEYGAMAGDREKLRVARERRVRPHRDEKIVAAWNGQMIQALAAVGAALEEPRYVTAAEGAAAYLEARLMADGRLHRDFAAGALGGLGYLDDYAEVARGYLALYEATFDPHWLERARDLARSMLELFARPDGALAYVARDAEPLLISGVVGADTEVLSPNAAAADLLLRLGHLLADRDLEAKGRAVIQAFTGEIRGAPAFHLGLLSALDYALGPKSEVIIAGPADDAVTQAMWREVRRRFLPNTVTAFRPARKEGGVVRLIPYLKDQPPLEGKPTAYVCRNYTCQLPVHEAPALAGRLGEKP